MGSRNNVKGANFLARVGQKKKGLYESGSRKICPLEAPELQKGNLTLDLSTQSGHNVKQTYLEVGKSPKIINQVDTVDNLRTEEHHLERLKHKMNTKGKFLISSSSEGGVHNCLCRGVALLIPNCQHLFLDGLL